MNCDDAKLDIALWVGNDLNEATRVEELRRHIAVCPDCRLQAKSLQSSMVLLGAVDQDRTYDPGDSLWPELERRIDYLERTPQRTSSPWRWVWGLVAVMGVTAISWSLWPEAEHPAEPQVAPVVTPESSTPTPPVSPGYSHSQYLPGQGE